MRCAPVLHPVLLVVVRIGAARAQGPTEAGCQTPFGVLRGCCERLEHGRVNGLAQRYVPARVQTTHCDLNDQRIIRLRTDEVAM